MLNRISIFLLVISAALILACSQTTPTAPNGSLDSSSVEDTHLANSETQIWMSGTMIIEPETGEGTVLLDRQTDWNVNLTGFLSHACGGSCFTFTIVDIVGTVLEIEMTIENPTSIQIWDIRIIFDNLYGKTVLNPDSYTDLFKPGSIRPFIAFAKDDPDRAFPVGPGATDAQTLFLDYPAGAQPQMK